MCFGAGAGTPMKTRILATGSDNINSKLLRNQFMFIFGMFSKITPKFFLNYFLKSLCKKNYYFFLFCNYNRFIERFEENEIRATLNFVIISLTEFSNKLVEIWLVICRVIFNDSDGNLHNAWKGSKMLPVGICSSEEVELRVPGDSYSLQHDHGAGDQREIVGH